MRSDFTVAESLTIGVIWAAGMIAAFRYGFILFGL